MHILSINNAASNIRSKCDVTIKAVNGSFSSSVSCLVIQAITDDLPAHCFDTQGWNIPANTILADPNFNKSGKADLLIGASLFWSLLTPGEIELGKNIPVLQNTVLGYIVSGTINLPISKSRCYFNANSDLQQNLSKFWELEECKEEAPLSLDDIQCETEFKANTVRNEEGRFVVRIPPKHPSSNLGDSKQLALKRLQHLKRRFRSNHDLKRHYTQFMREYQDLGHMVKVNERDNSRINYFLPHHGVLREGSLTTKLRVVFDGSAVSSSGWSLNDLQFTGPAIQNDIFSILIRFRQHNIVVTADIEKMYRQILVHPSDRHLQRIAWRDDSSSDVSVFDLNTVTYGTSSASYLAIRCLKQVSVDCKSQYPLSSTIIARDFYVDDLITGFETEQEVVSASREVSTALNNACFNLRKWKSNNDSVRTELESNNDPISVLTL